MFGDATELRPIDGAFDVDLVSAWLRALPFTRQNGSEFLIADSYEDEDAGVRTRLLIIDVAADRIVVSTRTASTTPASELLRWLEKRWRVEVKGEPLAPSPPRVCRRRLRVEDPMLVYESVGDFVITQRLHGTADRGVFAGYEREHERDVIFTINSALREGARPPRAHRTKGIARLRHVGPLGERAVLIEDEPAGERVGPVKLSEMTARTYAKELLGILDDATEPLGGLAPQLVWAENGSITGIAPRAQELISAGKSYCYGVPALFTTHYLAPEILGGKPYDEAADVFAAGVIVSIWLTGEHPFRGEYDQRIFAMMGNQRRPWKGPRELSAIVDAMLAPNPADRPLAVEAIDALE